MTEAVTGDWRERLERSLDAEADTRDRAINDEHARDDRAESFRAEFRQLLADKIQPAFETAQAPWLKRKLTTTLRHNEPYSLTLLVAIMPLGECTLQFSGDALRQRVAITRTFGGTPSAIAEGAGDYELSQLTDDVIEHHINEFLQQIAPPCDG